jgi:hypothetical protein
MQTLQADYFAAYRNLELSRDDKGVLVTEFHSGGNEFIMSAQSHTEFVDAFHRIGQDGANKIDLGEHCEHPRSGNRGR